LSVRNQITRRDFLNGVAIGIGAALVPARLRAAEGPSGYPPAWTGMRGSTDVSAAVAHALRDGQRFAIDTRAPEGEVDLAVVGAGISGLAAAYYFRQRHPSARILILDNHDDFGGHARRCEMRVGNRLLVSYGGSEAIQSPGSLWSKGALALLQDLGVDLRRFETAFDRKLYPDLGLSRGLLFARGTFGVDKLVTGDPTPMIADDIPPRRLNARSAPAFINDFPLSRSEREGLITLYTQARPFPLGKSVEEKLTALSAMSYRDFLSKYWRLSPKAIDTFQNRPRDFFAVGIDLLTALEAAGAGYPGFDGLHLPVHPDDAVKLDEPYIYHFPDGNASIARLLVRKLIPAVAPGTTMGDIVMAPFDYSRLDERGAPTRIRLNSTVVTLANAGERADIGYVQDGVLKRVHAKRVVYAGYGMMLPYVLPELSSDQKRALSYGVKAPLVYVKLAVRDWRAWVKAGVHEVTNTTGFYSRIKLDYPVSLGGYEFAKTPNEPTILHLVHVPLGSGGDQRTAWRAGRTKLYETTFGEFETRAKDELTRILGAAFDPDRAITAISVYRWAHGYAYGFNSLFDKEEDWSLQALAREPIGRITVANSDAAWSAYAHAAIDEAARAVSELHEIVG
jgi:spermidine dehydrogenase